MSGHEVQGRLTPAGTSSVAVDREAASRFTAGSEWEVVASSLENPGNGPDTVIVPLSDDGDDERGSR